MKLINNVHSWHIEIHQNRMDLPWLLLIHGFMGSGKIFTPLIPDLSKFCNPVTLDLPGHGESGKPHDSSRYTTEYLVNGLASVLKRLELKPLIVHGYSMGGRLALQTALHCPERIDALVLESTTAGIADEKSREERKKLDKERADFIRSDFRNFLENWQKLPLFSPPEQSRRPKDKAIFLSAYRQVMGSQDPKAMAAVLEGFGTGTMPSCWNELTLFDKPVCLLSGEHDEKFQTLHNQMNQGFPNSKSHVLENAAHRTHLDNPSEFLKLIQTFIQTATDL